jgi:hypothetical protein
MYPCGSVCDKWLSISALGWVVWTNRGVSWVVQHVSWVVVRRCGARRRWLTTKVKVKRVRADRLRAVKDGCRGFDQGTREAGWPTVGGWHLGWPSQDGGWASQAEAIEDLTDGRSRTIVTRVEWFGRLGIKTTSGRFLGLGLKTQVRFWRESKAALASSRGLCRGKAKSDEWISELGHNTPWVRWFALNT